MVCWLGLYLRVDCFPGGGVVAGYYTHDVVGSLLVAASGFPLIARVLGS